MLQLVQCLRLVSDAVSGEMAYEMEKALEHLESPERAAEEVLESMLSSDRSGLLGVQTGPVWLGGNPK